MSAFSASVDTSLNVGANYELAPNVFIRPAYNYNLREYEGAADGELVRHSVSTSLNYRMNKNMWWGAEYRYTTQEEENDVPFLNEYDRNLFTLSLRLQL